MTNKELVLDTMRRSGNLIAKTVQENSGAMTGTELNAEQDYIPSFVKACEKMNMMERTAGQTDGFVCKSTAGRVVRLIQNYDSNNYIHDDGTPWEPEELPAQWGFVWSDDPAHALPFIALSTSPYMAGNCCTENDTVYRSIIDNNVWPPSEYPQGWEEIKY